MRIVNPAWPAPKKITAFTSLKHCDFSELKLPPQHLLLKQQHGTNILAAEENILHGELPIADGSYTTNTNLACIIKTADCLPLLVTNTGGDFVAALHCGWRGLAAGIIDNLFTVINNKLNHKLNQLNLNLNLSQLLFYLGPAIGPQIFEVGSEIMEKFRDKGLCYMEAFNQVSDNNNSNSNSNSNKSKHQSKYLANIYQLAIINLQQYGINQQQIFSDYWCTYTQDNLFYSYRRGCEDNDRMYSVIWIE
jgi:YfiH family protein